MMPPYDTRHPIRVLICVFVIWKFLLLLIAIGAGLAPAYDTSSTLTPPYPASFNETVLDLATRLTRWDAIYFVQVARRGYLFEQEWAFGGGMSALMSLVARALQSIQVADSASVDSWIGIVIAHASHLLAVLALYHLGQELWRDAHLAFVAALLHIVSPAGLFLSAPYQESPFALLSFVGYLLFAKGCLGRSRTLIHDVAIIASGMVFGVATTFRSNGLLNGILFAAYAAKELSLFIQSPTAIRFRQLLALGVGGIFIALGSIGPQAIAYQRFCSGTSAAQPRPWCLNLLPSIYTFVQERYWNVGFLRYWTPGNIPLFLLAAPMIYVMLRSGIELLSESYSTADGKQLPPSSTDASVLIFIIAVPQILLTFMAITSYHIQIITRISSGYPLWYFWLARGLGDGQKSTFAQRIVVFMVMYAGIQGALFASFLPPA